MSQRDRLQHILEKDGMPAMEVLDDAISLFRDEISEGGELYPLEERDKASMGCTQYMLVANDLEKHGFFAASETLLLQGWNDFGLRQREAKKRVYRAALAFKLTDLYLRWDDNGAALGWALHTQADDLLGGHGTGGGAGKEQLRTIFGMSQGDLGHLNRIAEGCREEVSQQDEDWSRPAGFAEEVVRRFAREEQASAHLLAEAASLREFPLSNGYFQALLERVDHAQTTREKGDSLEDLAFYLFLLLPGCVPRGRLLDEDLAGESDVIVRNLTKVGNLTAEVLGRHFLVECKNWESRVNASAVGYFLYRMRLTHARFGIMFSKNGITGDDDGRAARALIRRAFHEDGSVCVIVDRDNLKELERGDISFWWMLLEKIERLRFGKPRSGHARR